MGKYKSKKRKGKNNYKPNNINRPYTYLVTDGQYYKIGSSLNPFRRVKELQTANPSAKLLGYTKKYEEKRLHDKYKKWRVKGEWFNLPQYEVDRLLTEMKKPKKKKSLAEIKELALESYIIPYGDYKGKLLSEMTSVDDIRYLRKQIRELPRHCEEWAMFVRWCNKMVIDNNKNLK